LVYSKDFDSAKDRQRQAEAQGGRFASSAQNLKNKANTARLQGDKTFEAVDEKGDTYRYGLPGREISVSLYENLSLSDQARVNANRNIALKEKLTLEANNKARRIDAQRGEMIKHKAIQDSRRNTQAIESKVQKTRTSLAELEKQRAYYSSPEGRAAEKARIDRMSRGQKRRYDGGPLTRINSQINIQSETLTSLNNSLNESRNTQNQIKKSARVYTGNRRSSEPTSQRMSTVKVNYINRNDSRSVSEQMKSPSIGPVTYGPYIREQNVIDAFQGKKSDSQVIVKNREKLQDDKDRSQLRTLSDNKIVQAIPFLQKPAKDFDAFFETGKLPKEKSDERRFKSKEFKHGLFPSNQALAGFFSPASNLIASVDDIGKGISEHIQTKGKSGFLPADKNTEWGKLGLGGHAKSYNPKFETAMSQVIDGKKVDWDNKFIKASAFGDAGLTVGMIATGGGPPKYTNPKTSSPSPIDGIITVSKPKGGGGSSSNVLTIKPDYTPKQIKSPIENIPKLAKVDTFPTLPKPDSKVRTFQMAHGRTESGVKFKAIKDLNTGNEVGLMGQAPYVKAKPNVLNIKKDKPIFSVDQPTEFTKGKAFNFGKYQFTETRNNGIRQTTIKDMVSGKEKTVTKVPLGETDNFKIHTIPKKDPLTFTPRTMKDLYNDAIKVEKKTEFDFSGGKNKRGDQSLIQKQKQNQIQKQENKISLESIMKPQKQSSINTMFKNTKINLGTGKGTVKNTSWQKSFVPIIKSKPSSKNNQGFTVGEMIKPAQGPKQGPRQKYIPIVGFTPKQTPAQIPEVIPKQTPVPVYPYRTGNTNEVPPFTPTRGGGGFFPYIPKISLGSFGYGGSGAVKSAFAAYGISSDINIKTLPTYSRYSKGTSIFKAHAKEDKKIQALFYGKPTKSKSKAKSKSKSKAKKSNTRKKRKK